jgi:hypothetical protein
VKKAAIIGVIFVALFGAAIYFSMSSLATYRCEVCIEFRGQTACGKASGATEKGAQRAASGIACSSLASGVADSMACDQATPKKVTWLK